jgi:hypothetical protein
MIPACPPASTESISLTTANTVRGCRKNKSRLVAASKEVNAIMLRTLFLTMAVLLLGAAGMHLAPAPPEGPVPTDKEKELLQERLKAAKEAYRQVVEKTRGGYEAEGRYVWSKRILDAEVELAQNNEAVIAAFQFHFDRMDGWEKDVHKTDEIPPRLDAVLVASTAFYTAEAKLWLEQAKTKKSNK